jgi:hypothetical protein
VRARADGTANDVGCPRCDMIQDQGREQGGKNSVESRDESNLKLVKVASDTRNGRIGAKVISKLHRHEEGIRIIKAC